MRALPRRHLLAWLTSGALSAPWTAHASETPIEVEGFSFEPNLALPGGRVLLNGAAVSSILSVRTNVVALYLPRKTSSVEAALTEPGPKRLCFYAMRDVSAKDLSNTFLERLRQNATQDEIMGNFVQISQFGGAFGNRTKLSRGDFIAIDFTPATNSTIMTLNGQRLGDPMQGEGFFRMMMKIWMGPKVKASTRSALGGEGNRG